MTHNVEYESCQWQLRNLAQKAFMHIIREDWETVISQANEIELLASHANRLKNGELDETN